MTKKKTKQNKIQLLPSLPSSTLRLPSCPNRRLLSVLLPLILLLPASPPPTCSVPRPHFPSVPSLGSALKFKLRWFKKKGNSATCEGSAQPPKKEKKRKKHRSGGRRIVRDGSLRRETKIRQADQPTVTRDRVRSDTTQL